MCFLNSPKMQRSDSDRTRYLMKTRSYIAIAITVVSAALLTMFLLQFNSSAAAQSKKNTRVPSSNGSSDTTRAPYPNTLQTREEPKLEPQNSSATGDKSVV